MSMIFTLDLLVIHNAAIWCNPLRVSGRSLGYNSNLHSDNGAKNIPKMSVTSCHPFLVGSDRLNKKNEREYITFYTIPWSFHHGPYDCWEYS